MTTNEVANLIPDAVSRTAWVRAGMPTDLSAVAEIVTRARQAVVLAQQATCPIRNPRNGRLMYRPSVVA
jgi:hypothetical protein